MLIARLRHSACLPVCSRDRRCCRIRISDSYSRLHPVLRAHAGSVLSSTSVILSRVTVVRRIRPAHRANRFGKARPSTNQIEPRMCVTIVTRRDVPSNSTHASKPRRLSVVFTAPSGPWAGRPDETVYVLAPRLTLPDIADSAHNSDPPVAYASYTSGTHRSEYGPASSWCSLRRGLLPIWVRDLGDGVSRVSISNVYRRGLLWDREQPPI